MRYIGHVKLEEAKAEKEKVEVVDSNKTRPRFIIDEPISDDPKHKKFAKGTRVTFLNSKCGEYGTITGPSPFLPDHSDIRWDDGYTGCYRNAILEEVKHERHLGGI